MRKWTILAMVVTLICGVVIGSIPALCYQGSDDGHCDAIAVVRGGIRLANSEVCQGPNASASCTLANLAGLNRK